MTTLTEMGFETKDLPSVAFQSELSLTNKPILTNEEGLAEFTGQYFFNINIIHRNGLFKNRQGKINLINILYFRK
jgi:hypothetical protein